MTINEYQKLALRTSNIETKEGLLLNGALGLAGETGEVVDHIKKYFFQGHTLDKNLLVKELGDVCWYIAILAKALNVDLETIMVCNIDKLKKRYPNGFSFEDSIHRAEVTD
jgi:NTP pyrophosphatase (non-canonical NTP hydrolase)